jgi:hypothetical protein
VVCPLLQYPTCKLPGLGERENGLNWYISSDFSIKIYPQNGLEATVLKLISFFSGTLPYIINIFKATFLCKQMLYFENKHSLRKKKQLLRHVAPGIQ